MSSPTRNTFTTPTIQTTIRTPGQIIRPVRAQTSFRQQSPVLRPQGPQQQKIQVIQSPSSGRPAGVVPTVRQPMIINTSSLMPPAQGSQKMTTNSTTNLARYVLSTDIKLCFLG